MAHENESSVRSRFGRPLVHAPRHAWTLAWTCSVAAVLAGGLPSCGGANVGEGARVAVVEKSAADGRPHGAGADRAVADAAERYVALVVETAPERATALGLRVADGRLDDRSPEGAAAILAREEALLAELDALARETEPSPSAAIDLAVLRRILRVAVTRKRVEHPLETDPSHYLGPVSALFEMLARPAPDDAALARDAVLRLEAIPGVLAQARTNLENPSQVATEIARDDARGVRAFLRGQRKFLERHSGDPARARKALEGAALAYAEYASFLDKVLLPRSTGAFAVGREHFEFLLREGHALDEDAEEVRAVGLRAMEKAKADLARAARDVDASEDGWPRVADKLKADHPSAEALVPTYRREVERARAFLVDRRIVPLPEGDELLVQETPPFARATTQAAYGMPPPLDDTATRGLFFVTPAEKSWPKARQEEYLREHGRGNIVDTVVHEAYPGHHLQVSYARRHPSLVRRIADFDIFCEGWAFYAEEMMAEAGYYTPAERLLQLEWALVRAARVVIDVGLHTGTMTLDEATALLEDEVHLEPVLARSEARRYALSPTQPLTYVLGESRIRAMRERFVRERGADLAAFHRAVLDEGSIPPALVERAIFGEKPPL